MVETKFTEFSLAFQAIHLRGGIRAGPDRGFKTFIDRQECPSPEQQSQR